MKALINSLKRTSWFKAALAFLTCLLFMIFHSCQKDEFDQDAMLSMDMMSFSYYAISPSAIVYYGPETFTITSKEPVVETQYVWKMFFSNFHDFALKVKNGNSGKTKVSKIEISINGTVIINSSDFRKNTNIITKQLSDFTSPAELKVLINGSKGSFIELLIEGKVTEGTVNDVEGNTYKTVKIGNQWWMAENLKATKYRNGDLIGTTTPATLDISAEVAPKYQWAWGGIESNVATYGRLYTWNAITDIRGACPTDWHIPSDIEWTTLIDYLIANGYNYYGITDIDRTASSLAATTNWDTPPYEMAGAPGYNPIINNTSGFNGLPGGMRDYQGVFSPLGRYTYWWTATEETDIGPWYHGLTFDVWWSIRSDSYKSHGFSVRCVQD